MGELSRSLLVLAKNLEQLMDGTMRGVKIPAYSQNYLYTYPNKKYVFHCIDSSMHYYVGICTGNVLTTLSFSGTAPSFAFTDVGGYYQVTVTSNSSKDSWCAQFGVISDE